MDFIFATPWYTADLQRCSPHPWKSSMVKLWWQHTGSLWWESNNGRAGGAVADQQRQWQRSSLSVSEDTWCAEGGSSQPVDWWWSNTAMLAESPFWPVFDSASEPIESQGFWMGERAGGGWGGREGVHRKRRERRRRQIWRGGEGSNLRGLLFR